MRALQYLSPNTTLFMVFSHIDYLHKIALFVIWSLANRVFNHVGENASTFSSLFSSPDTIFSIRRSSQFLQGDNHDTRLRALTKSSRGRSHGKQKSKFKDMQMEEIMIVGWQQHFQEPACGFEPQKNAGTRITSLKQKTSLLCRQLVYFKIMEASMIGGKWMSSWELYRYPDTN